MITFYQFVTEATLPSRAEQDVAIQEIKAQLKASDAGIRVHQAANVLARGRPYYMDGKSFAGKRARPMTCFLNARAAVAADSALAYVEGYIQIGDDRLTHHAWTADQRDVVRDPTLRKRQESHNAIRGYFGVPFTQHQLDQSTHGDSEHMLRERFVVEATDNQLTSPEQDVALKALDLLHADKESSYAKAYDHDAVKLTDIGFKDDGWHYKTHPGSDINSDKIGRLRNIPLHNIGFSREAQDATAKAGIRAYILRQPDPKKGGWPEVGQTPDGRYHIISGHTRLAAVALSGRGVARVRVFQYTQEGVWLKKPVK